MSATTEYETGCRATFQIYPYAQYFSCKFLEAILFIYYMGWTLTIYVSIHRIWNRGWATYKICPSAQYFSYKFLEAVFFIYCLGWTLTIYLSIHKIWNMVQSHISNIPLCTVFQLQVFRNNDFYLTYGLNINKLCQQPQNMRQGASSF